MNSKKKEAYDDVAEIQSIIMLTTFKSFDSEVRYESNDVDKRMRLGTFVPMVEQFLQSSSIETRQRDFL